MVVLVQVCGFAHVCLSLCVDLFIEHLLCESYSSSILSPCPVPGNSLGPRDTEGIRSTSLPSWNLHSGHIFGLGVEQLSSLGGG